MTLGINKSEYVTKDFVEFLVRLLKRSIIANIDRKKLRELNPSIRDLGIDKTAEEIILSGALNITYSDMGDWYSIHIDHNKKLGNSRVESLCKMLEYGNMQIKPQNIFSKSMDDIRKNIKGYFDLYCFMPF